MTYSIKEIFYTLQGEGFHAGKPAVFLRFAGCNVWSGREEDRQRDVVKGGCAQWCDTDFVGGTRMTREEVIAEVVAAAPADRTAGMLVVCTGGEPSLQLDEGLVSGLKARGFMVAVETNGSRDLPVGVDWVCVSPKPPMKMQLVRGYVDEVKVVFPAFDPEPFMDLAQHRFIQPQDDPDPKVRAAHQAAAVAYVMKHPQWRVSTQTHKVLGIR